MTFTWAKILLSSSERRALFKSLQIVLQDGTGWASDDRVNKLLDGLDDGGIWNPCFLHIPENEPEQHTILYAITYGSTKRPELEHDLKMILDRFKYIGDRERPKGRIERWPFLTGGAYYGPNWDEVRKEIVARDDYQCQSCGLDRQSHKERHGHDLHVHHITPKGDFDSFDAANDPDNLTTLCFECHRKEDPNFRASLNT